MNIIVKTPFLKLVGAVVALTAFSGSAQAAKCVSIDSVVDSAVVADNALAGGHVGAHVKDVGTPGRVYSSVGKTVYNSSADFSKVWSKLVGVDTTDCPDNPIGGANAASVDLTAEQAGDAAVKGYYCKTVDATEVSKCTDVENEFDPSSYHFKYQYKNSNWILFDAYLNP